MNHEDLNQLLNALMTYAQQLLNQQGQFLPFAAAIRAGGEVELIGGQAGGDDTSAQEIRAALLEGLRQGARDGKYRATGLCSDMRVQRGGAGPATDAIGVVLEHSDGTALSVYLPYERQSPGRVQYGDLYSAAAEIRIFPAAG